MQKNPYKFTGPLDPVVNKNVCIRRTEEIDKVITGIRQGDYWTILGPRQIGKTTFLRQLKHELSVFPSIYIDMEISPKNDESFYEWVIESIKDQLPTDTSATENDKWKQFGADINFYYFLRNM